MNGTIRSEGLARPETTLPRRSVWLVILFVVITFGIYQPFWFLTRRRALNGLRSTRKLGALPVIAFLVLSLAWVTLRLAPLLTGVPRVADQGSSMNCGQGLLALAACVFQIYLSFRTKDILEDHLWGSTTDGPLGSIAKTSRELSGVFTFLFSVYYLQHVINTRLMLPTIQALSPVGERR